MPKPQLKATATSPIPDKETAFSDPAWHEEITKKEVVTSTAAALRVLFPDRRSIMRLRELVRQFLPSFSDKELDDLLPLTSPPGGDNANGHAHGTSTSGAATQETSDHRTSPAAKTPKTPKTTRSRKAATPAAKTTTTGIGDTDDAMVTRLFVLLVGHMAGKVEAEGQPPPPPEGGGSGAYGTSALSASPEVMAAALQEWSAFPKSERAQFAKVTKPVVDKLIEKQTAAGRSLCDEEVLSCLAGMKVPTGKPAREAGAGEEEGEGTAEAGAEEGTEEGAGVTESVLDLLCKV